MPRLKLSGQRDHPFRARTRLDRLPSASACLSRADHDYLAPSAAHAAATSPKLRAGQRRRGSVAPGWMTTSAGPAADQRSTRAA